MADLIRYFEEYAPSRFKKPDGTPYKLRTQYNLAKKLQLPLIHAGHTTLIDPERADAVLREQGGQRERQEQPPTPRRGRGRPRLYP